MNNMRTGRFPSSRKRMSTWPWAAALMALLIAGMIVFSGCSSPKEAEDDEPLESALKDEAASGLPDVSAPSNAGKLKVEGAQLVSQDGDPVQLKGVSTHGLAWYPGYVNQAFFDELRQDWGANVVRLAMYTAESGGYCTDGNKAELEDLVRNGVAYAEEADLYAIVDWHVLSDQDPNEYIDEAKAFFSQMSSEFAGKDNVLYEICNEPNGSATWESVSEYAEEVIPIIRDNDPNAVVIVGTPTWSQDVDKAAADPLAFDNIMYALHFYAATHQQDLRDRLQTAVEGGLPIFVTEFGICDASGSGQIDYESADAWVELMDSLDVSYICWNLSNKDEASALFLPDCDKTSGFDIDDLSAEGLWLVGVLHAPAFDVDANPSSQGVSAEMESGGSEGSSPSESSGSDLSGQDGTLVWTAHIANSWETNGKTFYQYGMSVINEGGAVDGWSVSIPLGFEASVRDSWNCSCQVDGNALIISNVSYNATLAANDQASDIGFIISAS